MQSAKLEYIQCNKQGYHYGEVLNMVCIEQGCLENIVCCCACVEEAHKNHATKPLRMIMSEAHKRAEKIKPIEFNIDVVLDVIQGSLKSSIESFTKHKKQIYEELQITEKQIVGYYSYLIQEIKLKNSDPKKEVNKSFEVIYKPKGVDQLKSAVKTIAALIPTSKQEDDNNIKITEAQIIDSLKGSNEDMTKLVNTSMEDANKKIKQFRTLFNDKAKNSNIWKFSNFKFSPTWKHANIKLINETTVKAINSSGYKFAIMEPDLESGGSIKTFAFKIKECTSNWVAIGMCHKNVVVSKSYGFNFSAVGHGGYMVSANGGTWSHSRTDQNNAVKAFKFIKGDTVTATANFDTKVITFKKNSESYSLNFGKIQGDKLYPCVLFYYVNDEVEFLNKV